MIIALKVIPGARKNCLISDGGPIKAYLTAPPVDGKANDALVELLAEHFAVKRSAIEIIKGLKSRNKVINIRDI